MTRIKLNHYELPTLKKASELSKKNIKLEVIAHNEKYYIIEVKENDIDMLREYCADLLLKNGFDENYNPTEEGKILEDLIDKLYEA